MPASIEHTLPYRLIHSWLGINNSATLNHVANPPATRDGLAVRIAAVVSDMKSLFYGADRMDYTQLKRSPEYQACSELLTELCRFELDSLTTTETRRAFWIDLYNILIVNAVIDFGVRKSALEIGGFFTKAAYKIGGYRFSANDIEHGILRNNAGHPYIPGRQFHRADSRLRYALPLDPRVHFALNCAAVSCPPIASYKADQLDSQLDLAANTFINNGGVEVDLDRRVVSLSRIFLWYGKDFAHNLRHSERQTPILHYVASFLADDTYKKALLDSADSFRIIYQRYNWSLNYAGDLTTTAKITHPIT